MTRKCLLIGINYKGTGSELSGCINDIQLVSEYLSNHGYEAKNQVFLRDDQEDHKPTRARILKELTAILDKSTDIDKIIIEYSGHGGSVTDLNGDEDDGKDECLFPIDFDEDGVIVDDDLHALIQKHCHDKTQVTILIDACHSGTMLDLPVNYVYDERTQVMKSKKVVSVEKRDLDVMLISGCLDTQTSADAWFDKKANGAMSKAFHHCLTKYPDLSARDLVKKMNITLTKWGYPQRPQLSCGKSVDITVPFRTRI